MQFLYNRQNVNMACNEKIYCALCPRARRVMATLRCHLCSHFTNFYGTFVSACYICSGHFWTRSEPYFGHEDNVVVDACGESKSVFSPVNPFIFECTRAHTCDIYAHSLIKARTFSIRFLYFPWRIVSQKFIFKAKNVMF